MYQLNPVKRYGVTWRDLRRMNMLHSQNVTRQPGWGKNEHITFNDDCDPYWFWQLFEDIGKLQLIRNITWTNPHPPLPLTPPNSPPSSLKEGWPEAGVVLPFKIRFTHPLHPKTFRQSCNNHGCDYLFIGPEKTDKYILAPSLDALADLAVSYGRHLPGPHNFQLPDPDEWKPTRAPNFFERFCI